MTFTSKFEIEEEVYFYNEKAHKVEKGKIEGINLFYNGKTPIWIYVVQPIKYNEDIMFPLSVGESLIFKDRDEVFRFAYLITEGI